MDNDVILIFIFDNLKIIKIFKWNLGNENWIFLIKFLKIYEIFYGKTGLRVQSGKEFMEIFLSSWIMKNFKFLNYFRN